MLLRGIYTFNPRPEDDKHALGFVYNDILVFLELYKRDKNWFRVVDINGRIGYVPVNFVEPDENCRDRDLILTILVDAVVKARQNGLPSVSYLETLRDEVRDYSTIIEMRSNEMFKAIQMQTEQQCSDGCGITAKRSTSDHHLWNRPSAQGHHQEHTTPQQAKRVSSHQDVSNAYYNVKDSIVCSLPPMTRSRTPHDVDNGSDLSLKTARGLKHGQDYGFPPFALQEIKSRLVNVVQETSGLDPKLSENLLVEVFQGIKESTSSVPMESLVENFVASPQSNHSLMKLEKVMKSLTKLSKTVIKGSSQRRISFNSELDLSKKLSDLRKLLIECNTFQVTQLLNVGQRSFPQDLVHLYHLEYPQNTKERMLDIFHIICTIDKPGRAQLLATTLPLVVARELMAANGVVTANSYKFHEQLINLMITLLASAETMPSTHLEVIGTGFVNFVMKEIEETAPGMECDKKTFALVKLLLAYNLQFIQGSSENVFLRVLAENRRRPKVLLGIVMDLFKSGCEPLGPDLRNDAHHLTSNQIPNSVFKMVTDMCLCQRAIEYLTSADMEMLLEVMIDGLMTKPAGKRLCYLTVLRAFLGNWHRNLKDVRASLLSILLDTDPLAFTEQETVRAMSKEFPVIFIESISRVKMNADVDSCIQPETDQEYYYTSS